ncbi:MAG: L,D-transpeptidase family protein [Pacificimonas sp.]
MKLWLALFLPLVAIGPTAAALPPGPLAPKVGELRPGDWLWAPSASPAGEVVAIISLPLQRVHIYRNGVLIGISTVSTGKPGHDTPTGVFTILQKRAEHYSNLYNDAPMPHMQRLTWDGIALHAGRLPGHPASHGCIRLPDEFAARLFDVTTLGATVIVTSDNRLPRLTPRTDAAANLSRVGEHPVGGFWTPDAQPDGPVSIIVSATDETVRVIRGGVEIGGGPVGLGRPVTETEVHVLASMDRARGRFDWRRIAMDDDDASGQTDRESLTLSDQLRSNIAEILHVGATVVVTPDSLDGHLGAEFDILAPETPTIRQD